MDNHEAFNNSYARFIEKLDGEMPISDLEHGLEYWLSDYLGARFLAIQMFESLAGSLHEHYRACESPIEKMMLSGLLLVGIRRDVEIEMVSKHFRDTFNPKGMDSLTIQTQAGLGDYRADFLLTYRDGYGTFRLREIGQDNPVVSMIVECDGHDFHDRTKEQASDDRKRDRFLRSTGLMVFRYTGADIWKDVCACAAESLKELRSIWGEKFGADVKRVEDADNAAKQNAAEGS